MWWYSKKLGLMFEERNIELWTYNLETVLAEKIETGLSRGVQNTRLRDFYDIYILQTVKAPIDCGTLVEAIRATSNKRDSEEDILNNAAILDAIELSQEMQSLWSRYQRKTSYAAGAPWRDAMAAVRTLCKKAIG